MTPLYQLPSPFQTEWGTLLLLEPPGADAATLRQQLLDESYAKPFIVDDGSCRYLYFNVRLMQSAMRIKAPDALELRYTQQMMAALLFCPRPRRILLIGLGGGSLAKFCYRRLPGAHCCAVELDPNVIALRDVFMVPDDDDRLQVVAGDGREYLAGVAEGIDLLLVDAFNAEGIAPGFADRVFVERAYAKLSNQGVLVMNLAGERQPYEGLIHEVLTVFDDRTLLLPVHEDGNHILFAFRDPAFALRWRWLHNLARELRAKYGLDFPGFAQQLERAARRDQPRRW